MHCEKNECDWAQRQGWMSSEYERAFEEKVVWLTQKNGWRSTKLGWQKLLDSAVEVAGMLHIISKPRLWRGGTQVLEDVCRMRSR